ncbi:hypothetical protein K438DRAFT_1777019 [Mycena galopus ATCC 62051]|nr:hypothetical protein K438DRAFT_1777019 [Mycena galopus ATCC 62051]
MTLEVLLAVKLNELSDTLSQHVGFPAAYGQSIQYFAAPLAPTFVHEAPLPATGQRVQNILFTFGQPSEVKLGLQSRGEIPYAYSGLLRRRECKRGAAERPFTQEYGTPKKYLCKPNRRTSGHASTATAARQATPSHGMPRRKTGALEKGPPTP